MAVENIINHIPEFDYEAALSFCGGEEEFFEEILQDYADSGKDLVLQQNYQDKNWEDYEINIHSLKSTSRMMGFPQLGDICEKLQEAVARGDLDYIDSNHESMLETYKHYIKIIKEEL